MRKIIAYILTPIYFFFFALTLLVFHPIQWLMLKTFGYRAHKVSVDYLNFSLLLCHLILGNRFSFTHTGKLPTNIPLIIVSNHQSMFDIPPIIWHLRRHHPKFISKKELGKGIPSVSFNLRHGGSVLIDRKNPEQAVPAIAQFGEDINHKKRAAVIFPEGTRSRTGQPKKFQTKGLKTLLETMPNALVLPISINNSWKILRYGKFPMGVGNHITLKAHEVISPKELGPNMVFKKVETTILEGINK